ncbi:MAG: hypothetical protein IKN43_11775 [Selenomonadaceae bacterium]|nr:hypothetical protein [Selenomonadaceae bacterium]
MNLLNDGGTKQKVIIYGIGDFAECLYESIKLNGEKVGQKAVGFVVDDEYWNEREFCGETVCI